jgi:hypothetical protein
MSISLAGSHPAAPQPSSSAATSIMMPSGSAVCLAVSGVAAVNPPDKIRLPDLATSDDMDNAAPGCTAWLFGSDGIRYSDSPLEPNT